MKKVKTLLSLADINWLIDSMKLIFPTKNETIKKLDAVSIKLDTFITEIKAKREEDILHTKQHDDVNDRLETIEKKLQIPSSL